MNDIEKAIELLKRSTLIDITYTTEEHGKALKLAIEALEQQLTNAWTPETEKLPDKYKGHGIYVTLRHIETKLTFVDKMKWRYGRFVWPNGREKSNKYEVIAWMPIKKPERYVEEVPNAKENHS